MANPFVTWYIIASPKSRDYDSFLIIAPFVKTKEMSVNIFPSLLHPIFAIFCGKHCGFLKIDLGELEQIKMI